MSPKLCVAAPERIGAGARGHERIEVAGRSTKQSTLHRIYPSMRNMKQGANVLSVLSNIISERRPPVL